MAPFAPLIKPGRLSGCAPQVASRGPDPSATRSYRRATLHLGPGLSMSEPRPAVVGRGSQWRLRLGVRRILRWFAGCTRVAGELDLQESAFSCAVSLVGPEIGASTCISWSLLRRWG